MRIALVIVSLNITSCRVAAQLRSRLYEAAVDTVSSRRYHPLAPWTWTQPVAQHTARGNMLGRSSLFAVPRVAPKLCLSGQMRSKVLLYKPRGGGTNTVCKGFFGLLVFPVAVSFEQYAFMQEAK